MTEASGKVLSGTYEFRCRNCGSPLDVSPETIVAICSYCGYPNWIREDLKSEVLVVPALDESRILEKARERVSTDRDLKKIKDKITIGKPYLLYIPYYFADARSEADYWGRVRVRIRKCTGSGKDRRCETYTRIVTVSGHYGPFSQVLHIVARRGVGAFSIHALGLYYLEKRPETRKLEEVDLLKSKIRRILGVEIDRKTAADMALDEHLDSLRDRVTEEMISEAKRRAGIYSGSVVGATILAKRITPKNIDIKMSQITLLPLYIIPYKYQSGTYRFFMSGWDGVSIIAEEPMNMLSRLSWGLTSAVLPGILGGAAAYLLSLGKDAVYMGAFLGLLGMAASYYAFKMATRPVRVEVVEKRFQTVRGFLERTGKVISALSGGDVFSITKGLMKTGKEVLKKRR